MAVLVKDTVLRCKLCKHPERAKIDALLEQRSRRELNTDQVLAALAELGVDNPNLDNIKGHLGQKGNSAHTVFEGEDQAEKRAEIQDALQEAALQIMHEVLGEDWREKGVVPTPDQILEIQRALYVHELELKIAAGVPVGLTHDHVLKTIGEGTKRKLNEAQAELLGALGGAVGAFGQKMIQSGDVIVVEDAEEAEVKELPSGEH